MKDTNNIFIMGDSYSTYEGYIPEEYPFYYSDERNGEPIVNGVKKTWWSILANEKKLNIILNDSFSGSTICNTVREDLTIESSFVSRIDKYIEKNFFKNNIINTMYIFGGTNDSWVDAPIGNVKYSEWTVDDLKCVLPAFCYLIYKASKFVDDIIVIINTDLKEEISNGFREACEKFQVKFLNLIEIEKQNGHPTELGMKQISNQIIGFCDKNK